MVLLLDKCGDRITVTENLLRIIVRTFSSQVMALLLDRRGDQVVIREGVVKAACEAIHGMERKWMALLLDRHGDQVTITEDVVKIAAGNGKSGRNMMALLLDRRSDQVTITENVVKAAARNHMSGQEVMTHSFLADAETRSPLPRASSVLSRAVLMTKPWHSFSTRVETKSPLLRGVVEAAAGNVRNGRKVMALLLDRCRRSSHDHREWDQDCCRQFEWK